MMKMSQAENDIINETPTNRDNFIHISTFKNVISLLIL